MFPPLRALAHPGRASARSLRHGSRASFSCQSWPNESLTLKYVLLANHYSSLFPLTPANIPSNTAPDARETQSQAGLEHPLLPSCTGHTTTREVINWLSSDSLDVLSCQWLPLWV